MINKPKSKSSMSTDKIINSKTQEYSRPWRCQKMVKIGACTSSTRVQTLDGFQTTFNPNCNNLLPFPYHYQYFCVRCRLFVTWKVYTVVFSSYFCFLFTFVWFILVLSVLVLVAVFSLPPRFSMLSSSRCMHQQYPRCCEVPFFLLFWAYIVSHRHL